MNKKPNIIFILTDDQGAWAMHCAGNGDVHTPNLDRIAAQGIRLTIFFVHPLSVLQQELRYSPVPFHLVMGYRIGCLAVTFRLT